MPDPPEVNLFSRYVLENPAPLTIVLVFASLAAAWVALREGRRSPMIASGVGLLIAGVVFMLGTIIITPAERGRAVTEDMVERIVNGEINEAMTLFSPNATFAIGSPQNPGMDISYLRRQAERLHGRYAIQSNRITTLRGYTESPTQAIVHMTCRTEVGNRGPTPTQWVVQIEEQPDGQWRISRLTMVSVYGRTPNLPLR